MIVDAWMQHPTPAMLEHPMLEPLRRWLKGTIPDDDLPLDATLAAMEDSRVDVGLVSAWTGPGGALISNDQVAAWCRKAPERLRGVGSVDISDPMTAVREVHRCVEDLGFVAIRVVPWLWGLPPDDRRYYPVYVACTELDVPFCLQVGHTGPLRPSEPGRPIPYLDHVALEFPDLTIVGGHIGHPWTAEMVSLARKYPNVYIDTSAYSARRYPQELVDYLRSDGAERVLFATNYPMLTAERALDGLDDLGLTDDAREAFLAGNARRVFGLD